MTVKELILFHYRNISYAKIPFKEGMNFLLGENAQGKTNALEAIYLFSRGKSFRGATDAELLSYGTDALSLTLSFSKKDREETLFYGYGKKEKAERIRKRNGILLNSQAEMLGSFRAVLFSPDHLQMVKGSPSERRSFLNIAASGAYPVYLSLYARYTRVLEQRNALLKEIQKSGKGSDELSVWNEKIADAAADIFLYRKEYIHRLNTAAAAFMKELSGGKEELSLIYQNDICDFEEIEDKKSASFAYLRVFSSQTEKEIALGSSQSGVHRDDILMLLNGKSARDFASQGQQRSIVLALKMAEGEIIKQISGESPVYLFDDVLSELDEGRRKFLLSGIESAQFIVTGCEKSILGEYADGVNFIKVENGAFYSGEKNAKRFG